MRLLPPTYLLAGLVLQVLLHFASPMSLFVTGLWRFLGIVPIAIGVGLNLRADTALHRAHTTVKPDEVPTELVTSGPYSISRHPMYLGFVLILLGVALLLGSRTPFLVVPIFGVLMEVMFIRQEEAMLSATFGDRWAKYQTQVRRWI